MQRVKTHEKLLVGVPKEIVAQLRELANKEERTLSYLITKALQTAYGFTSNKDNK